MLPFALFPPPGPFSLTVSSDDEKKSDHSHNEETKHKSD
jgi:hypothetical protein